MSPGWHMIELLKLSEERKLCLLPAGLLDEDQVRIDANHALCLEGGSHGQSEEAFIAAYVKAPPVDKPALLQCLQT